MNILDQIKSSFTHFVTNQFNPHPKIINNCSFDLNVDENKQQFGDINANHAMIIAKELKRNPREIAQEIAAHFKHDSVEKIEIAGPGFLNFYLTEECWQTLATELATKKRSFFKLDSTAPIHNYDIEFVSANPTGPLHLGHGRGGIIGDVLANILSFLGHQVTREFYVNDAGAQIKKLGLSFKIRLQQQLGQPIELPEEAYHGDYLVELAKKTLAEHGKEFMNKSDDEIGLYAKNHMLEQLKQTLENYGVKYDVWFSEKTLHTSGAIEKALEILDKKNLLYEKDGATWFKSTDYGDDKDRVVRKADGELTYVAADIAYMLNKVNRGFDHLIMTLGQDHHSYVSRLQGLRQALQLTPPLDIILYQLVRMKEGDKQVRMSKRSGAIITLEGVIEEVGRDVARFFYLNRKADAQLEFDLDLALKRTDENPVYYLQYAYVRINSILNKAETEPELAHTQPQDIAQLSAADRYLLKKIISLKNLLENIACNYQTHLLAYYAIELATAFHAYYSKNRVIELTNIPQSRSRLEMIKLLRETLEICLDLLGLSKPEKM